MRGGPAARPARRSAHATRGAQCHYLPFRRAASPPLRPRPLSSTRCAKPKVRARAVKLQCYCTNSTGSVPGPFCARAGSAPALDRAWMAPCRRRPRPNRRRGGARAGSYTPLSLYGTVPVPLPRPNRRRAGLQLEHRPPVARVQVGRANGTRSMPGRAQAKAGVAAPRPAHTDRAPATDRLRKVPRTRDPFFFA